MYEDGSDEDVSVKAQSDSGTVSERMLDFDDHQQVISSKPSPVSGVQFSYDDVINKSKKF